MPFKICNLPEKSTLLYLLIFVVIVPFTFILNNKPQLIKLYLIYLIPITYLISKLNLGILDNLYSFDFTTENIKQYKFSTVINIITIISILWNVVSISNNYNFIIGVIYGVILVLIKIPLSKIVIDKLFKLFESFKKDNNIIRKILISFLGLTYLFIILLLNIGFYKLLEIYGTRFKKV